MVQKYSRFVVLVMPLALMLAGLACNLSSDSAPPTLMPRASDTPLPTIGYATLSPTELPQVAIAATAVPRPGDAGIASIVNQVESDRLILHIDNLQNTFTRHVNSTSSQPGQGVEAAYTYIKEYFERLSAQSNGNMTVFVQEFPVEWAGVRSTQRNVVAIIAGNEIGAGTIILGAHYDSITSDPEDGAAYAPGANDNASGTAALMEIGRILSRRQHRASIMLVAFGAEEIGRDGSRAFVQDYIQAQQIPVTAMINMDIIGSSTGPNGAINDGDIRLFSEGPNDSESRKLARMVNLIGFNMVPNMEIVMQDAVDRDGRYGDHMSFSNVGYPAVRFIEALEESTRQHSPRDTLEDIQPEYLTASTRTILSIVTALADGPRPPQPGSITLQQNGSGTRTLVWGSVPGASSYIVALRRPNSLIYEQFETTTNTVTWDGFVPQRFEALAIAAKDGTGLMGPLSQEFVIPAQITP